MELAMDEGIFVKIPEALSQRKRISALCDEMRQGSYRSKGRSSTKHTQGASEFRTLFNQLNRGHQVVHVGTLASEVSRLRAMQAEMRAMKSELARLRAMTSAYFTEIEPSKLKSSPELMRLAKFTEELFQAPVEVESSQSDGDRFFVLRPRVGADAVPDEVATLVSKWHDHLLDEFGPDANRFRIVAVYR